jgi:NAD(P)-dependent dehydrogenase (short-subunit alcohol dehydrogenase family)
MHVLITGASGGLGTAVVEYFLNQGAQVTGVARSAESCGELRIIAADLTSPAGARQAWEAAHGRAPVDAVLHLMGGFGGGALLASTTEETWRGQMAVNVDSAFHVFRAALPDMTARRHGRLVAIGSKAALDPIPGYAAYSVSKAALVALVRALAAELAGSGVTANAILPGTIDTPANRAAMPDADFSKWIPPARIAATAAWLASDAAAGVNGALIPMFGG